MNPSFAPPLILPVVVNEIETSVELSACCGTIVCSSSQFYSTYHASPTFGACIYQEGVSLQPSIGVQIDT